jgi:hypothetical protein
MRWTGHTNTIFVVKLEVKRPAGTPRCRWENNIIMDLREIGLKVWTEFV